MLCLRVLLDLSIEKIFALLEVEDWDCLQKQASAASTGIRQYIVDRLSTSNNPSNHLSRRVIFFLFSRNSIRKAGNEEAHTASKNEVLNALKHYSSPPHFLENKSLLDELYAFTF